MIDPSQLYCIVCCQGDLNLYIPPGAGESPMPLQCMPMNNQPPSLVRCISLGGDKYKLIPVQFPNRVIAAYHEQSPKMLVLASDQESAFCYTEWGIDTNGEQKYEIHTLTGPGNEYWTSEGPGVGISLQGSQGLESQQWKLMAIQE